MVFANTAANPFQYPLDNVFSETQSPTGPMHSPSRPMTPPRIPSRPIRFGSSSATRRH